MAADFSASIRRIYLFQALVNVSFWMPVWVVFLNTTRHLPLGEVYLIAGAGWVVMAIAEVPTGAFSDTFGRRRTLILGGLVLALGMALLATLNGFAGVLIAYLFWAIGNAMINGSDSALLYDTAVAAGRETEFQHMASRSFQILLAAQALGSIVGGLLGAIDLRLPIIATAALTVAAVAVISTAHEAPRTREADAGAPGASWGTTLRGATRYVRPRPRLAALLGYTAVLSGTAFFVPFVLFQPAMREQGVPVAWLGVLFMALRLAALAGTRYGPRFVSAGSLGRWLWAIPALMFVGFIGVAASGTWWLTLAMMLFVAAVNAIIRPETTTLLNRQVTGSIRATVLSLESLVQTLFIAAVHPAVGAIADRFSTSASFVFLAALCALPVLLAIPLRPVAGSSVAAPGQEVSGQHA